MTDTWRTHVFALMKRLRTMRDGEYLAFLIAYHAAPTLMGEKPATLICPDATGRDLFAALKECGGRLKKTFGVKVAEFRNCRGALLLLIYHPARLRDTLASPEVADALAATGYGNGRTDVDRVLSLLGERCACRRFPHEIGLVLGYPPDDVRLFIARGGRCGRGGSGWKSYGDQSETTRRSDRFRRFKERAAELIAGGADFPALAAGLVCERGNQRRMAVA